jgi:hypothetical protein
VAGVLTLRGVDTTWMRAWAARYHVGELAIRQSGKQLLLLTLVRESRASKKGEI